MSRRRSQQYQEPPRRSGGCGLGSFLSAMIVTVVGGLIVWWLTTDPNSPFANNETFVEELAGTYAMSSWIETTSPYTLYVDVQGGELTINDDGSAVWNVVIDDIGADTTPKPEIACRGEVLSEDKLMAPLPGGTDYNLTSNLMAADRLGTNSLHLSICGRTVYDVQREGFGPTTVEPFSLSLDGDRLEMRNSEGFFIWQKQ